MTSVPDGHNPTACVAVSQRLVTPYSFLNLLIGVFVIQTSRASKARFNIRGRWNQISVFFKEVILFGDTITIQVSGNRVLH